MRGARVRGGLAGAILLAAAGCLDITPNQPSQFPCPDGTCPAGSFCGSDGFCQATSTSTSSGSSSSGSSIGASSSGSTSSGSTLTNTGSSSSSSGTTGGSSSGGSSSGAPPADFGGEWDTNFAHVSLAQDGGVVTGQYHDWGYTYLDPTMAGTISGTVQGSFLTGSVQQNGADGGVLLSWSLSTTGLDGVYGPSASRWCGVPAGQGTPLPIGCGWSDSFGGIPSSLKLQQIADEVTGTYFPLDTELDDGYSGTIAGVVSRGK